jgi:Flp pilus assembly protein TadG
MAMKNSRRRGNAVIEFAIGSSLFVVLFSGTFQFGYSFYIYENLCSAARAGARYGTISVYQPAGPTVDSSPASSFVTQVQNMAVYGNPAGTGSPVVAGLRPEHVDVDVEFANNMPSTVTVSIQGFEVKALYGTWRADDKPSATFKYMGRYEPPMPSTL